MQTTEERVVVPEIEVRHVSARPCVYIAGKATVTEMPRFIGDCYQKLFPYAMSRTEVEDCFARFPAMNGEVFDIEVGVVTKAPLPDHEEIRHGRIGGHQALYALYKGPYAGVGPVYEAMQAKMKDLEIQPAGAPYEIYLNDPAKVPPDELETELYWPAE